MKASNTTDYRLKEYYVNGNYKGFYKINELKMSSAGNPRTHLTFSNGHKEILSSGLFTEDALEKVFDKIDNHRSSGSKQYQSGKKKVLTTSPGA